MGGKCTKFKVTAGRVITCVEGEMAGKDLVSIDKEEGYAPTRADAMARYLVSKLNRHKDFERFYQRYLK